MTIKAGTFTPQVLLSAPRRSAGVPNLSGTHVLYTQSTYCFASHSKTTELRCLATQTNDSHILTSDEGVSEPVWLEGQDDTFVCLKSGKGESTDVVVCSIDKENAWQQSHVAGTIDAEAGSLKIASLGQGKYAIVVAAKAKPNGELYNAEKATKTQSTGTLYKALFVRHWDHYVGKERNSLWYGTLKKEGDKFVMSGLVNALKGTGLESPIPPFGGADCFDVSKGGIIFVAKDESLNPALNSRCICYLIELSTFQEKTAPVPFDYSIPGLEGAASSPVFSPDGSKAAYLQMAENGYEADRNQMVLILDVKDNKSLSSLSTQSLQKSWDRSPSGLAFSVNGDMLLCTAEDMGHNCLFGFPLSGNYDGPVPAKLTEKGSVNSVAPLASGSIFVSGSSLVDNSVFYTIPNPLDASSSSPEYTHSATKFGATLGLSSSQVSSITFPASNPKVNKTVHAFVVKPSNFDPSKKYPLAMLVHGGPQGSWTDSWSTRWNPAIFAEQGYIVVSPNPTGSTGYGQAFTDAIAADWGGQPYEDIVNCFSYIESSMPEVDTSRAVALGASYGGYMMNWINGHPLGRKFKALVCHDGVFSMVGQLASDELYFTFHDLGGVPWSKPKAPKKDDEAMTTFGHTAAEIWAKNDPSNFLSEWDTPALVIHSELDYRLTMAEGLAAFNVLQTKGVESQFLVFPDENHWVLKPENSLLWHKVVLNWINKFVGLPAFSTEDEESEEFYGGVKEGNAEVVNMMASGKPET